MKKKQDLQVKFVYRPAPFQTIMKQTSFVGLLSGEKLEEVDVTVTTDSRRAIETFYKDAQPISTLEAFFTDLEKLLGIFRILARQERDKQPDKKETKSKGSAEKAIKNELERGEKQLKATLKTLRDLVIDPEIRPRLDAACNVSLSETAMVKALNTPGFTGVFPGTLRERMTDVDAALGSMLDAFGLARKIKGAKAGRPPKILRKDFVQRLWSLVETHCGKRPTTTREGPFEELVRVCFETIGWEIDDLNRLAVSARSQSQPQKPPLDRP